MLVWFASCSQDPSVGRTPPPYPLDDVLRFDDLQALGTHNSYHVQTTDILAWRYTHAPLPTQLEVQGVRQFELDVAWDEELGEHRVFHVDLLDAGTTCETFSICVAQLALWSRRRPRHHPVLVLVETKDPWDELGPERLDALDRELFASFPEERLILPSDVQGDHPDLRSALEQDGWPVLGELRGKTLFVLHDGGDRRAAYVTDLAERSMFPDAMGDLTVPWAAVHTMNDPFDPAIATVLDAGHLVRTRADSDGAQAEANDTTQADQAFASGAQFVSTDYPTEVDWTPYVVRVPDGNPSRCNPLRAPPDCDAAAIEDLLRK